MCSVSRILGILLDRDSIFFNVIDQTQGERQGSIGLDPLPHHFLYFCVSGAGFSFYTVLSESFFIRAAG